MVHGALAASVYYSVEAQRPTKHIIGNFGDDFHRPNDQTNSYYLRQGHVIAKCPSVCLSVCQK